MLQKNVAGQKWAVYAWTTANGLPVTGGALVITAKIRKDYGSATAVADTNPTELESGYYEFDLTQAESNADVLDLIPVSGTAGVIVVGSPARSFTIPPNFNDMLIGATGLLSLTAAYDLAKTAATPADVLAQTDDIRAQTDQLLFSTGGYVQVDVEEVLQVPPDGLPPDVNVASIDTVVQDDIINDIWDELLSGHVTVGSAGATLSSAGAAGDPLSSTVPGAYGAGTAGFVIGTHITGNAFTRLGAPVGASISADIAAAAANLTTLLGKFTGITLLAQWLGLIAGKQVGNSTARTEVRATGAGSGTYDETTDAQEALRDRGDAAWVTGSAGATVKGPRGLVTRSVATYSYLLWLEESGVLVTGVGLTACTITIRTSVGDLVLSGTASINTTTGLISGSGTLTSPLADNTPGVAYVTITHSGVTYTAPLGIVALA